MVATKEINSINSMFVFGPAPTCECQAASRHHEADCSGTAWDWGGGGVGSVRRDCSVFGQQRG